MSHTGARRLVVISLLLALITAVIAISRGRRAASKVDRIYSLFDVGDFEGARMCATAAELDPVCADSVPEIMYVHWVADRRLHDNLDAARIQRTFIDRFPDNPMAADMRFETGIDQLLSGDKEKAGGTLRDLIRRFPSEHAAIKATEILRNLRLAGADEHRKQ